MAEPVRISWDFSLPTHDLALAWEVFSDTDRLNRSASLGFAYTAQQEDGGTVSHKGQLQRVGMKIRWDEEPFEFEAPHWFRITRRFHNGPASKAVAELRLEEEPEGIRLRYQVAVTARNRLTYPIVYLDTHTSLKPALQGALNQATQHIIDQTRPWGSTPPPLSDAAIARISRLRHMAIGPGLIQLLETGDVRAQNRMRPLALAAEWKVDPETAVEEFVTATQKGILQLHWDLLCPACNGPKTRLERLDLAPDQPICTTCNIAYDGTFPDSVEVTFSPDPGIRDIQTPIDCVLSPHHTPQVIAQSRLFPGKEVQWKGTLEPGSYWIETSPNSGGGASIEVRAGLRAQALMVDVGAESIEPTILRLGPGQVEIVMRSRLKEARFIRIEQRWRPEHTLTAGHLLEHPTAQSLLPAMSLPDSITVETVQGAVVAVDARAFPFPVEQLVQRVWADAEQVTMALETLDTSEGLDESPIVYASDKALVAVVKDFGQAIDIALRLGGQADLGIAVAVGTVTLMKEGDTRVPSGEIVASTIDSARRAGLRRIGMKATLLKQPGVANCLAQRGLTYLSSKDERVVWVEHIRPADEGSIRVPLRVGDAYEIGDEIGRGGFGVVHRVTDVEDQSTLVLKSLLPEHAADPCQLQRFLWEARLTSRIDSEHVVNVIDYGIDGNFVWFTMEELQGQEWADLLQEPGGVPWQQTVQTAIGVLAGLEAAHGMGVIHRDVKPENIFICRQSNTEQHPMLIDFGIAIAVEEERPADEKDQVYGTPKYVSPEQVEQEPLDGRSDIYTMGLVLYEALSGDIPFKAKNPLALALQRLAHAPEELSERNPELPKALCDVVMKALQLSPADRFESAKEMADALAGLL